MKKIALFTSILLLLNSCGIPFFGDILETDNKEGTGSSIEVFTGNTLSFTIPNSWDEIPAATLPVPKTGNILIALRSPDLTDNIYRNLIVLENQIIGDLSSEQYARNDYAVSVKKYSGYRELERKEIQFSDNDTGQIYIFEAKYNPDSPRMKFIQSSKICKREKENTVYNITIALAPSIIDLAKYESLIKSMSCLTQAKEGS